jgi:PBP1b-binding outer membrane lipoprotein LpoB
MKKLLMAMLALVMMAGCSSETSKPAQVEKPQPKPAEFVTGAPPSRNFSLLHAAGRAMPSLTGWNR